MIREQEALDYHGRERHGKLEVVPSKPCSTQLDLSLAYTPGVAVPCRAIEKEPLDAYRYTGKGNLVAVVSNGSAVLGLGNIGALAGKPVMEGKGVLFKRFADVDVFDIELETEDPEEIIRTVEIIAPTFGGINLEDIKAPECFRIEETLQERLSIPVFHDDQHGTAIISGAALLNALSVVGKRIDEVRVVFNGAGAGGVACARYYVSLGVRPENMVVCDSRGVIWRGREQGMNPYKEALAVDTEARTLEEAIRDADVFVGLSVAGSVTPEMVRSMAAKPVLFAMANPDPEISYEEATAVRSDLVMATGRSDYPNQVNNVLGFPFIFRGAMDARATAINQEMKLAATRALAALAREDVPDDVMKAYGLERLHFGPEYLIPKPFDHRVLIEVASAVAAAAMESGVAGRELDLERYREELERRLGKSRQVMRFMINQAKRRLKRVVLPEGENPKVLRATQVILDEAFAQPVLLGNRERIEGLAGELDLDVAAARIIDPRKGGGRDEYLSELFRLRARKGVTLAGAAEMLKDPVVYGAMMVHMGDGDALVAGVDRHYPDALRPALQVMRDSGERVHGVFVMVVKDRLYFFADPTVTIAPTAEELAEIAVSTAEVARHFHVKPRIAMISFSNFGSVRHPLAQKMRRAAEIVRQLHPELMVDGEMQADTALSPELMKEVFPFSSLQGEANVLIFPNLEAANIAFKLLQKLGGAEAIGPLLTGMRKPVHILQHGCGIKDIVYLTAIAAVDAEEASRRVAPRELVALQG